MTASARAVVRTSHVAPIKSERDYDLALAEVRDLMNAAADTARGDRLDVLVALIESYEAQHWAIDPPDPIDAIKLRMEERGLSRADLQPLLGGSGRVSEILNRKRPLTLDMMRKLYRELDIPAEAFFVTPKRRHRGRGNVPAA